LHDAYEVLARREAMQVSLSVVARRQLLVGQTTKPLTFLDLRPHANGWPFLQSMRYSATQRVASQAHELGFDGIVYRSAQQFGADCYVVFGELVIRSLKRISAEPLMGPAGGLHRAVATALTGAQIDLVA
jgi:RES domain-containing protein